MNEDLLRKLKECYDEATKTCQHTRTHPSKCDDCNAPWCFACDRFHVPTRYGCEFAYLLKQNARELINMQSHDKRIQGLEASNRLLQEKLFNVHNLWTCDMCNFSFHAQHSNEDGSYTCPVCAEAELFAENWNLKADLKDKSDRLDLITYVIDNFRLAPNKDADK